MEDHLRAKEIQELLEDELITIKAEFGWTVMPAKEFAKALVNMAGGGYEDGDEVEY